MGGTKINVAWKVGRKIQVIHANQNNKFWYQSNYHKVNGTITRQIKYNTGCLKKSIQS